MPPFLPVDGAPRITGASKVVGVIGDPITHSLSPVLHNAAFHALAMDWVYVAFPVAAADGAHVVAAMQTMGVRGLSVTTPHKDAVARSAHSASADVRALGAANTLLLTSDGRVHAETTDGDGCVDALREHHVDVAGKRVVLLGAGGAGRSVALALYRAGAARIVIVNRDDARADAALMLTGSVGRRGTVEDVTDADVIINATSIGMGAKTTPTATSSGTPTATAADALPFPLDRLAPGQVVNDLVYNPIVTPLLAGAADRGAITVNGVGMLLHQGARQFRLWTGEDAPIDAMRAALHTELERRQAPTDSSVSRG